MSKKKSKLTLIIDGNWLFLSRMSILVNKFPNERDMMKELKLLMIKSINVVLRTFPLIDNIIFVADGGSWRNKIEIPDFLKTEGIEYKGNRHQSDDLDWDIIFGGYEDFISKLAESGITTCRENGIEGDDWCWFWSRKLNKENTNCIIWSKDRDLTQLVKVNENNCFTAWWNKDNGIILEDNGVSKEDDFIDKFFFNPMYLQNSQIEDDLIEKSEKAEKIKPLSVVIDKIIRGDQGDNVYPVILKEAKNNSGKKFRVSQKDIDYELDINNSNKVREYVENLLNLKSYKGRVHKTVDEIVEHFDYNKRLVLLEENSYPEQILEKMNEYTEYNCNKDCSLAEQKIQAEKNDLERLLEDIL